MHMKIPCMVNNCTPFEYLPFNGVTDKVGLRSVGEERANLSASVYSYLCGFCLERVPLPLGAWDGLHYFIVALPEPYINYFVKSLKTRFFLHLIRAKSIELRNGFLYENSAEIILYNFYLRHIFIRSEV